MSPGEKHEVLASTPIEDLGQGSDCKEISKSPCFFAWRLGVHGPKVISWNPMFKGKV